MEISKLCDVISSLNRQIHFVSVVNKNGRIIESKLCNDSIITNLTSQEMEMFHMQRILQTSMNKEHDDKLSPFNSTITERDSLLELIFPFYDGILIVMTRQTIELMVVVKKISKQLKEFEFGSEVEKLK